MYFYIIYSKITLGVDEMEPSTIIQYVVILVVLIIISLVIIKLTKKDFGLEINKLVKCLGGKDNILDTEVNMSRLKVTLKDVSIVDEYKENIPLLGEINKKDVSIGLVAIVLGLVDGFNPCAPDLSRVAYAFPEDPSLRDARAIGEAAHAAVGKLLAAAAPPDALVVHPDDLVPGAVAAVLESGRRPPRDLLCVFHRNRGMEPYVPFPCEWISHDVSEEAARWADRIEALLDGRTLPHELGPNLILPDKGSTA